MPRRSGRLVGLGIALLVASAGCFFPSYTYDLPNGGGSGGATTSSTGGSGGGPMTEDCLNGVDDNGDGLVDCADPQCQVDYECVDPLPAGWESPGYVAVYEAPTSMTAPGCPTGMATKVFAGGTAIDAPPATCSPCTCDTPTGQSCALTTDLDGSTAGFQPMMVRNAPACGASASSNLPLTAPIGWSGACTSTSPLPAGQLCSGQACDQSVLSAAPTLSGGMCAPSGGVADKQDPAWGTTAFACYGAHGGKGCIGSHVCKPKFKPPFKPHVCVEGAGDVACPSGSFSTKYVYYSDYTDSRDCTACSCGAPTGGSCEITLSVYSDAACSSALTSFPAGTCGTLSGNPAVGSWSSAMTKPPSGGSCAPASQSAPTGNVTPKIATTFCCE